MTDPRTTNEIANWKPIRNNLSLCQEVRILRGGECPKDVCSEYCSMAVELREMITQARAEGARAERERIKAAVEGLVDHIARLARHNRERDSVRCSKVLGELERYTRKQAKVILDPKEAE